MYTISETTKLGINFKRKTEFNMLSTGIAGLINLIGNYFLVPRLGGLGASISTGISFIVYFWIGTLISRKLWFNFDILFFIVNIALMVILAFVSVFYNLVVVEVLIYILIIIYNRKHVKYIITNGLNFLKSYRS